jgi:hypothetical protein
LGLDLIKIDILRLICLVEHHQVVEVIEHRAVIIPGLV